MSFKIPTNSYTFTLLKAQTQSEKKNLVLDSDTQLTVSL